LLSFTVLREVSESTSVLPSYNELTSDKERSHFLSGVQGNTMGRFKKKQKKTEKSPSKETT